MFDIKIQAYKLVFEHYNLISLYLVIGTNIDTRKRYKLTVLYIIYIIYLKTMVFCI